MKLPELNSRFDENKMYECPDCKRIESGLILRNLICLSDSSVRCRCGQRPMYMYHERLTNYVIK